jgi:hypothetical protein
VAAGMSGAHQSLVISALLLAGGWRCDGVVTNAENLQTSVGFRRLTGISDCIQSNYSPWAKRNNGH